MEELIYIDLFPPLIGLNFLSYENSKDLDCCVRVRAKIDPVYMSLDHKSTKTNFFADQVRSTC